MSKILFLANHFITLHSFRPELIDRLLADGHELYLSLPESPDNKYFTDRGCKIVPTEMDRHGVSPKDDWALRTKYIKMMQEINPDIIFSYTVKPNIYGSMAARKTGKKIVCNITGTGKAFVKETIVSKVIRMLYRFSVTKAYKVFFQNDGDLAYFQKHHMIGDNFELLKCGSGVNLEKHAYSDMPDDDTVHFIYIGRVLGIKGVDAYFECAKRLKDAGKKVVCHVAGFVDEGEYKEKVDQLHKDGIIDYMGFRSDIDDVIHTCHCTVLPSLGGEGVPNVMLESAADGRACIASDIDGSRLTVNPGKSGYLFEKGNADDLFKKMSAFVELTYDQKLAMGKAGRQWVEERFNRQMVIDAYCKEVEKVK